MKIVRYNRFLSCCLVATAMLCSCSKNLVESFEVVGDRMFPILPVAANVETRADLSGVVSGTSFPANTTKVFSVVGYSGSTSPTNWSSPYIPNISVNSGEGSALSFATPQYYPANGDKVYFYAYSPVSGTYSVGNGSTAPKVVWTITGQQDIMAAQVTSGIAKTGTTPSQPAFAFTHKLKQVKFKIKRDDLFASDVKLTSLQIIGAKTQATLNLNNGSLSWGSATGPLDVYNNSTGQEITTTATYLGTDGSPVMFEPGTSFKVRVIAGEKTYADVTVTLSGTNAGTAGVSHEVTLNFKPDEISVNVKAVEWTSSNMNVTFGATYPFVLNGNTIVTQDRSGYASGYDFHGPWTITPDHYEKAWDANESGLNTVSARFEVADRTAGSVVWDDTATACANYSQDSGGNDKGSWRVPTIQEQWLIFVFREHLHAIWLPSNLLTWTATREIYSDGSLGTGSWFVDFYNDGLINSAIGETKLPVRCVRDLE